MFGFTSSNSPAPDADVPAGDNIDADAWKAAEESVRGRNGGFAGVGEQEKFRQIKEAYDQIVGSNEQAAKWEGTQHDWQ